MKKIQKEIAVLKDVFVAEDGKEFESKAKCEEHEYDLQMKKYEDIYNALPGRSLDTMDEVKSDCDVGYELVLVKTPAEMEALSHCVMQEEPYDGELDPARFPVWMVAIHYNSCEGSLIPWDTFRERLLDVVEEGNGIITKVESAAKAEPKGTWQALKEEAQQGKLQASDGTLFPLGDTYVPGETVREHNRPYDTSYPEDDVSCDC